MIGIETRKRLVVGSHDGCSSESPKWGGMIVGSTETLVMMLA